MTKKAITPQQQLEALLNQSKMQTVQTLISVFTPQVQEDIILALVAYLRFGVRRRFTNLLTDFVFSKLLTAIGEKSSNALRPKPILLAHTHCARLTSSPLGRYMTLHIILPFREGTMSGFVSELISVFRQYKKR